MEDSKFKVPILGQIRLSAEVSVPAAIVDTERFLRATRDSGYRSVESALAELIDNALQAEAKRIDVSVIPPREKEDGYISVLDDGCGMSRSLLVKALQFGGSNRFNDRSGIGRFGMGLPNSSLSQGRRVEVYTWRKAGVVWHTYLDLDEILSAREVTMPAPRRVRLPKAFAGTATPTGTLVVWRKLDRIRDGSWRLLPVRLNHRLGQRFRYFLWDGRHVSINGEDVPPFDPLYLSTETRVATVQALPYGVPIEYPVEMVGQDGILVNSTIHVRFSELPVRQLTDAANSDKRFWGISNGAGVSIIRAGREIDYGWFLLDKRRENYDDWWRCEISFTPELDDLFGVNHTKQGIRPAEHLRSWLTKDLSAIARTLNHRVRTAFMEHAAAQRQNMAENTANSRDVLLRPLMHQAATNPTPLPLVPKHVSYQLLVEELDDRSFYRAEWRGGQPTLILNCAHDLYGQIYQPLLDFQDQGIIPDFVRLQKFIKLFLLALGRTELLNWTDDERGLIRRFVTEWSRATSVFVGGA